MKKLIAMALVIASLLVIVCSCATDENKKKPDENPDAEKLWLDNLPEDLDLEGAEIKFIIGESDPPQTLSARSIAVEEDDGDIVNSAIYNRNARIEDRLNCKITLVEAVQAGMQDTATPVLMAGDDDYDVLGGRQHDDIDLCLEGYCLNLNTLSEYGGDYIEVDQEWWGTEYIRRMNYNNQVYWLTGVLSLRFISGARCVAVNANLYNKYVAETYGNIYDIVKKGEWTLDVLGEMASLSYVDTNGNDKTDPGDIYGLNIGVGDDMVDAYAYAYGVRYSHENEDGSISFDLVDTNSEYLNFMNKITDIRTSRYSFHAESGQPSFSSGELLFQSSRIQYFEIKYREMEDDFYVVPLPTKNPGDEYVTTIHDGNLLFAISYCTPQIAQTAAVLEAMAAESYRSVMPNYYDTALKYKYTRDDNAAEIIDLIRDSVTTDFGFIWGRYIGCLYFSRRNVSGGVVSNLKKNQGTWLANFQKLINEFEEITAGEK